jgi:hypothetical protein
LITGDSDVPVVALEKGSFKTVALFGSLIQRDNLFGSLLLRTRVRGSSSLPLPESGQQMTSAVLSGSPWTATEVCWRKRP